MMKKEDSSQKSKLKILESNKSSSPMKRKSRPSKLNMSKKSKKLNDFTIEDSGKIDAKVISDNSVDTTKQDLNSNITSILSQLAKNERISGNKFKAQAYGKAASTISKLDYVLSSGEEAIKIRGIGKGISTKIQEIIDTGKLEILETAAQNSHISAINELCRVHGIGSKIAEHLYEHFGISSLTQLSARKDLLSHSQKVGLKYVRDFEEKIPRQEIEKIEGFVTNSINMFDCNLKSIICGSYRRGNNECGDIDILITHPEATSDNFSSYKKILPRLVETLKANKFIIDDLALGPSKYMGVCILPPNEKSVPPKTESADYKFEIPSFEDSDCKDLLSRIPNVGNKSTKNENNYIFKSKSDSMSDLLSGN